MASATWCLQFQNVLSHILIHHFWCLSPLTPSPEAGQGGLDVFPVMQIALFCSKCQSGEGGSQRTVCLELMWNGREGGSQQKPSKRFPILRPAVRASCAMNFDAAAWCHYGWHYQGGQAERSLSTPAACCPPPPPTDCLPVPASDLCGDGWVFTYLHPHFLF